MTRANGVFLHAASRCLPPARGHPVVIRCPAATASPHKHHVLPLPQPVRRAPMRPSIEARLPQPPTDCVPKLSGEGGSSVVNLLDGQVDLGFKLLSPAIGVHEQSGAPDRVPCLDEADRLVRLRYGNLEVRKLH